MDAAHTNMSEPTGAQHAPALMATLIASFDTASLATDMNQMNTSLRAHTLHTTEAIHPSTARNYDQRSRRNKHRISNLPAVFLVSAGMSDVKSD
jgi:hypothetical protein